ncbi:hypothetical protein ACI65C_010720 [Semiaphis heraclei]
MKVETLICLTIVLGISMMQEADGGKTVSEQKLKNWGKKNEEVSKKEINLKEVSLKKNKELNKYRDELEDLLEVIQYVITNAINNQEFRTFMIKRFLHNYIPQASEYLDTIKNLKKKMNPKAAKEDEKKDEAMKNQ